jgi:DNA helicase HerA-like ATPase
MRSWLSNLWDTARRDPRPRLLVLDELWSWLRRPELAAIVEEIARRGRKFFLALWIASQQIEELLRDAKAVFDNAAIRIFLQQEARDLIGLTEATHLTTPARQYLRGAGRGQALLYVNGMLLPVSVQADPDQYRLISTDPRERTAA